MVLSSLAAVVLVQPGRRRLAIVPDAIRVDGQWPSAFPAWQRVEQDRLPSFVFIFLACCFETVHVWWACLVRWCLEELSSANLVDEVRLCEEVEALGMQRF